MSKFESYAKLRGKDNLSPCARMVLMYLACRERDGNCFPAVETIAAELEYTKRAVQYARKELEEIGVIEIHQDRKTRGGTGCRYVLKLKNIDRKSEHWRGRKRGKGVHHLNGEQMCSPFEKCQTVNTDGEYGEHACSPDGIGQMVYRDREREVERDADASPAHARARELFKRIVTDEGLEREIRDRICKREGEIIDELTGGRIAGHRYMAVALVTSMNDVTIWDRAMEMVDDVIDGNKISDPGALLAWRIMNSLGEDKRKLVEDYVITKCAEIKEPATA